MKQTIKTIEIPPSVSLLYPPSQQKKMNVTKNTSPIIIKIIPSHKRSTIFFSSMQIYSIHSLFILSKIYPLSQYEGTHLVKFQIPLSPHSKPPCNPFFSKVQRFV
jgi:hypothetical protein